MFSVAGASRTEMSQRILILRVNDSVGSYDVPSSVETTIAFTLMVYYPASLESEDST